MALVLLIVGVGLYQLYDQGYGRDQLAKLLAPALPSPLAPNTSSSARQDQWEHLSQRLDALEQKYTALTAQNATIKAALNDRLSALEQNITNPSATPQTSTDPADKTKDTSADMARRLILFAVAGQIEAKINQDQDIKAELAKLDAIGNDNADLTFLRAHAQDLVLIRALPDHIAALAHDMSQPHQTPVPPSAANSMIDHLSLGLKSLVRITPVATKNDTQNLNSGQQDPNALTRALTARNYDVALSLWQNIGPPDQAASKEITAILQQAIELRQHAHGFYLSALNSLSLPEAVQ
jgi:hypothetical protein